MAFTMTHLGQNCFYLNLNGTRLLIDPYFSDSAEGSVEGFKFIRRTPVYIKADEIDADFVFCTHDHIDHLDPETVQGIKKAVFTGPSSCIRHYKRLGIGEDRIITLDRGMSFKFNTFTLSSVHAEHTDDSCGLVIECDGYKVYNVGDSLYSEELLKIKTTGIDLILVPINGKLGNMNAFEAAKLSKELNVKAAVPCHYDMFEENSEDPLVFCGYAKENEVKCSLLELNRSYTVEGIINS